MVWVAVRDDDHADLLGTHADPGQPRHQRALRGGGVGAAVDQGHRLAEQDVHVRGADGVRRRNHDPLEAEPVLGTHRHGWILGSTPGRQAGRHGHAASARFFLPRAT